MRTAQEYKINSNLWFAQFELFGLSNGIVVCIIINKIQG